MATYDIDITNTLNGKRLHLEGYDTREAAQRQVVCFVLNSLSKIKLASGPCPWVYLKDKVTLIYSSLAVEINKH